MEKIPPACYNGPNTESYGRKHMPELTSMMNIGREMARKLTAVGIDSPEKLAMSGAKQAFRKLKEAYPQVCLVHLYTLEGAIRNIKFNELPEDTKQDLKAFHDLLDKNETFLSRNRIKK